jgi:hypothetical protein
MSVNKAKITVLNPTLSIIKDSKLDLAVSPFESNQIKLYLIINNKVSNNKSIKEVKRKPPGMNQHRDSSPATNSL